MEENQQDVLKVKFIKSDSVERRGVFIPVEENKKTYKLEGLLSYVKSEKRTQPPEFCKDLAIVLTHPHPMLGGSFRNNVVLGVADYFTTYLQIPTLCFNFRGVSKSEGSGSWFGGSERLDTLAAVNYLLSLNNDVPTIKKVLIVGYSYGSVIGSSIADEHPDILGFSAISYPFGPLTLMLLGSLLPHASNSLKPKYFLIGDSDNFTSVSTFKKRLKDFKGDKLESKIFEGVDHFYGGNEKDLAKEIAKWICKVSINYSEEQQQQQQQQQQQHQ
ncbi:hypothetical protein DICPUDRAFT_25367 [Dictyostelium purpureum]|uniref:Dienelactone hydrolase domain-containing protein n=1 Tax=Dictyostelium purpureum TaxID=5786 RepID=F0Z706_DICPU|nr:uncharacterized protein DICPUDRAFT_25367 [Dictyostelium purpureum]EGC40249.1 hypothetical protein DICPUDRAFT_25367 [Dictyostelium purpureum]|eukprot:XP_003283185.1 hypothetical protein DICPUDRAFT_25367 [Dictyostelium purpureum]